MEVSPLINPKNSADLYSAVANVGENPSNSIDAAIIQSIDLPSDHVTDDKFLPTYTGLAISAEQILSKLNEALGRHGQKVEQLAPEDATSEATSDRILRGIKGLFSAYKEQNPELSGEKLVDGFIAEASKGVQQGYNDAYEILKGIGAFSFNGIEDSIAKTLSLVKEGLGTMREELLRSTQNQVTDFTTQAIASQGAFYAVA